MADLKISRGNSTNLPSAKTDGNIYFTEDTGEIYFDYKDESQILQRKKISNFYFVDNSKFTTIAGSSTTDKYRATRWLTSGVNGITTPTDGMTIAVRVPLAGTSGGILLSIDGGITYYPIVRNANTLVTTNYPVGSTIILTFNDTQTASPYTSDGVTTTITGCWQIADYDSNTTYTNHEIPNQHFYSYQPNKGFHC